MEIERWRPKQELSEQEERIIERMTRTGKLFAFLRRHRHALFDETFQAELESMYRRTGEGKKPLPPALMAMATLLQGYLGASDATLVELTVFDLRVQMVFRPDPKSEREDWKRDKGRTICFRQKVAFFQMALARETPRGREVAEDGPAKPRR